MDGLGPELQEHSSLPDIKTLPLCNVKGELWDGTGKLICTFKALKKLGAGTFGFVDLFARKDALDKTTEVALKRPKFPEMKLLAESLFQKRLHDDLIAYGLSSCVPQVYDIFRYQPTGDVWFCMEAFDPVHLSQWCVRTLQGNIHLFIYLLLQIALIIEVLELEMKIDHRDLKANNMIVVNEPISIDIRWKGINRALKFPFRIVLVDFGFACLGNTIDIRNSDGLPPLDPCPKEGRNIFQVLVSLWNIGSVRESLDATWGSWIRERISDVVPKTPCISLVESSKNLDWMYILTENRDFRAPLCVSGKIIKECMKIIDL